MWSLQVLGVQQSVMVQLLSVKHGACVYIVNSAYTYGSKRTLKKTTNWMDQQKKKKKTIHTAPARTDLEPLY